MQGEEMDEITERLARYDAKASLKLDPWDKLKIEQLKTKYLLKQIGKRKNNHGHVCQSSMAGII